MVWSPEKCFDETRYEYLEEGDSWARVHQGRVEQCKCAGGQVQCEDTRHTGTPAGRGAEPSHWVSHPRGRESTGTTHASGPEA